MGQKYFTYELSYVEWLWLYKVGLLCAVSDKIEELGESFDERKCFDRDGNGKQFVRRKQKGWKK